MIAEYQGLLYVGVALFLNIHIENALLADPAINTARAHASSPQDTRRKISPLIGVEAIIPTLAKGTTVNSTEPRGTHISTKIMNTNNPISVSERMILTNVQGV